MIFQKRKYFHGPSWIYMAAADYAIAVRIEEQKEIYFPPKNRITIGSLTCSPQLLISYLGEISMYEYISTTTVHTLDAFIQRLMQARATVSIPVYRIVTYA